MSLRPDLCVLCGREGKTTREHVIPRGLYPNSRKGSRVQRIVVPTCHSCNNGSSDDDVHFRNVLSMAGETNGAVDEVFKGKITRSLSQPDGHRRAADIFALMRPAEGLDGRFKIYPGRDPRILKILRKIIRGLSFAHGLRWPVADDEVYANVLMYEIPQELVEGMSAAHVEPDICEYRYSTGDDGEVESAWLLTFYQRTVFFGIVCRDAEVLRQIARGPAAP